jgi:hypothetical protein
MCLFSTPRDYIPPSKKPQLLAEYKVRPITLESVDECCLLMESVVGFSKRNELDGLVRSKYVCEEIEVLVLFCFV